MTKQFNIAIVGATGLVGETLLNILAERKFPIAKLYALASERSAGDTVAFNNKAVMVEDTASFDFAKADIAFFSAGSSVSEKYVPLAAAKNCICIDNTSQFRYDSAIPLVVPEVNPQDIELYTQSKIIANPNCSTIQLVTALKPIHDAVGITRINVATYQSVSGAGKLALQELAQQTANLLNAKAVQKKHFPQQIAFNVLPQIDQFQDNGYTREEMKIVWETRKMLHDENIQINATAVRVPVFYGHSEAVHIETKQKITASDVKGLLKKAPGITVFDDQSKAHYPTAVTHASGKDAVFVGRIREDISCEKGINLWIVADNIRKGAALNAVQIAEVLRDQYL